MTKFTGAAGVVAFTAALSALVPLLLLATMV
jgi:hypothetical protein